MTCDPNIQNDLKLKFIAEPNVRSGSNNYSPATESVSISFVATQGVVNTSFSWFIRMPPGPEKNPIGF